MGRYWVGGGRVFLLPSFLYWSKNDVQKATDKRWIEEKAQAQTRLRGKMKWCYSPPGANRALAEAGTSS